MEYIALIQSNAKVSIILFGVIISLIIILVTKYMTDQVKMKELKAKQKEFNKTLKEVKGDVKKEMEVSSELMKHTLEMFKHSMRPMIITLLPLLVFFWWLRQIFTDVLAHWIWYYIGASIVSSIIFRKVFDVA